MKITGLKGLAALFVLVVVPFALVLIFRRREWLGRIIALVIVFYTAIGLVFWISLNTKIDFFSKTSKMNKPGYETKKKVVDVIGRIFFLSFGVGLLCIFVIPLTNDVAHLMAGEKLKEVTATVTYNHSLYGWWFLSQHLRLREQDGSKEKCYFLFSLKTRLLRDKNYKFLIMPRSKLVLEAKGPMPFES